MGLRIRAVVALGLLGWTAALAAQPQVPITRVETMPNIPQPFGVRDWQTVARRFDRLAFDLKATGEHLPLVWLVPGKDGAGPVTFGLPSYVGDYRKGPGGQRHHEAITCIGAVLGASVAGIDKSRGPHNWVRMCEAYTTRQGDGVVANRTYARTGASFWYDLFPNIAYFALADKYPDVGAARRDLYDCVSGRFIARKAAGPTPLTIPADGAVVCVRAPAGGNPARRGSKLLVNGVVVDYRAK